MLYMLTFGLFGFGLSGLLKVNVLILVLQTIPNSVMFNCSIHLETQVYRQPVATKTTCVS